MASSETSDTPTRVAVLEHRADATDRGIELVHRDIDGLRREMQDGFGQIRREMHDGFGEVRREVNGRLDQMNGRLDQQLRWVITTVITTAFAVVGANVAILTLMLRPR